MPGECGRMWKSKLLALAITLFLIYAPPAQQSPKKLTPFGKVTHPPIEEMSGIIKSHRYPDAYWVFNDSGDTARIFAIHAKGEVIVPKWMKEEGKVYPGIPVELAANHDWEEITRDGDTLYIGDMGNNGNGRRDLGVYVVKEPNPFETDKTRALRWIPIAYPDQTEFPGKVWHFDCESVVVFRHKLYFLTKHRAGGQIGIPEPGTKLYRLDSMDTDRVNVLTKIQEVKSLGGWVTDASLSPDGKMLAVLCQFPTQSVWIFDTPKTGDHFLSSTVRRLAFTGGRQCEGVCFVDNNTLLINNEQRDIFKVLVKDFKKVAPPK